MVRRYGNVIWLYIIAAFFTSLVGVSNGSQHRNSRDDLFTLSPFKTHINVKFVNKVVIDNANDYYMIIIASNHIIYAVNK